MRVFRWIMITGSILVGIAALTIALAALWLNTYIQAEPFKHDMEARAGQTLGSTVQIGAVTFDLLHGIQLEGFTTQIDPGHTNGPGAVQVKVARVDCGYDWRELFHRRLKLTGVTLDRPEVILTQQPSPSLAPPIETPATVSAAPPSSGSGATTASPFDFVLEHARIKDGTVIVRDIAGGSIVEARGVNLALDTAGYSAGEDVTGKLKIADLTLPGNLHVTNFSTPVTYRLDALTARPFAAEAWGGLLAGGYDLSSATALDILEVNGKGLDLGQLSYALQTDSAMRLRGTLAIQSKWSGVTRSSRGEGDVQVTEGRLEGVEIFQELSRLLRVKELNAPEITRAQVHFLAENRQVKFIGLQLESTFFRLTGDGTVNFEQMIDANFVLILNRDTMSRLPKDVAASFVQQQNGTGSLGFHVTGTTSHPRSDLATRLLLQNTKVQNVIDKALDKFFH